MLNEIYNSCRDEANKLKGWQKLDKNEIANLYLDSRGTDHSSVYAAALLCKYWYKVGLIWKNNSNAMTQEDCYWIVWDGIERAMDYAPWRNEASKLYQDPNGPDKAINVCIESIRKTYYDFSNRDRRKANHSANAQSLDRLYESTQDYALNLVDESELVYRDTVAEGLYINLLIRQLADENRLPEAIVVDTICFDDSVVSTVEEGKVFTRYSERRLVSALHSLDERFVTSFAFEYGIQPEVISQCIDEINALSYNLLHKLIGRTLYIISNLERYKYRVS